MTPAQRKRMTIGPVPVVDQDPTFAAPTVNVDGISGARLRAIIERIEHLQSDIRGIQDDVKEIKKEAKGIGFDVKVINYLIRIRRQDADDLAEFETIADTYKRAIGMIK